MLGDMMEVLQGELAFFQLAVAENVVDEAIDHPLNPGRRRLAEGPARGLDHVREHDQAGFLGLGLGAGIAVVLDVDGRKIRALAGLDLFAGLERFLVKKRYEAFPVMLTDDIDDIPAQVMVLGELDAFLHVRDEDEAAHGRGELFVAVFAVELVFDEVERLLDLSDIVVVGRDLGQKGIGADGLCRRFHHVAHDDAVVVGTGGLHHELLQERLIHGGQL